MANEGFTGIVGTADVRFSQPVTTPVNTEVSKAGSVLTTGLGQVAIGGGILGGESRLAEARSESMKTLEDFDNRIDTDPNIYNEIRENLKGDYKEDVLKRLSNSRLRDLQITKIRRELSSKYGSSQLGQQTVDKAMVDVFGYVSPSLQRSKERRALEVTTAASTLKTQNALLDAMAKIYAVPRHKDGSYDIPEGMKMYHSLSAQGISFQTSANSNAASGGGTGFVVRNPAMLAEQRSYINSNFHSVIARAFVDFSKADTPEKKKQAASNIYHTVTNFKTGMVSGTHEIAKSLSGNKGNIFATYNPAERSELFKGVDATVEQWVKDVGVENFNAFNPENVSKKFLESLETQNKIVIAAVEKGLVQTPMGQLLMLSTHSRNVESVRMMMDGIHGLKNVMSKITLDPSQIEGLISTSYKKVIDGKGESNIHPVVSVEMLKSYFSAADPKENLDAWTRAIESVWTAGLEKNNKENRDTLLDVLDQSHTLNFFKELIALDEGKASNIFKWYSEMKMDKHEDMLTDLFKRVGVEELELKHGQVIYTGDDSSNQSKTSLINKSLSQLKRFKSIVPEKAFPTTKRLFEFFNKRIKARQRTIKTVRQILSKNPKAAEAEKPFIPTLPPKE